MQQPYDATDEATRREAVRRSALALAPDDAELTKLAHLAAHLLDVSMAAVVVLDDEIARVVASAGGVAVTRAVRAESFAEVVVQAGRVVVVPDAAADPAVRHLAIVSHELAPRMLAGAPLRVGEGSPIGALFVGDGEAKALSEHEQEVLDALAHLVVARLEVLVQAAEQRRVEDELARTARRFDALVADVSDVVAVLDADGQVAYASDAFGRLLGYFEVTPGFDSLGHVHPDDRELARRALAATIVTPGRSGPAEFRVLTSGRSWRWLEVMANNLLDDPAVGGVVLTARDITDRRRTEALLRAEAKALELVCASAPIDDVLVNLTGVLEEHAGPAAYCFWLHDSHDGALVLTTAPNLPPAFAEVVDVCDVATFAAPFTEAARRRGPVVVADASADESIDPLLAAALRRHGLRSVWAVPIIARPGARVLGVVAGFGDLPSTPAQSQLMLTQMAADGASIAMERQAADTERRRSPEVDELTGLPNRHGIVRMLDDSLARSDGGHGRVAVLMVDLDRFKLVNDRLGHESGDAVLAAVGERLRGALRPSDRVGRFGADEFVVVCEDVLGEVEAVGVASELAKALDRPLQGEIHLTASVGIAVGVGTTSTAQTLLRDADTAMYRAKERGAGRCEVFTEATRRRALHRADTERELRLALLRDELRVWYQPAVELPTQQVIGFEALVRWEHPERGVVLPMEFIPIAEETGLIVAIGERVLREACQVARRWRDVHPGSPCTMAVNLSARQLLERDLPNVVVAALDEAGLPPDGLCLEITESVLMEDTAAAVQALQALKRIGVTIAIDDFGTGYSSLSYLSSLPVDILKVDRQFVHGLGRQREHDAIVRAVVSLADALGLRTIAEGVETVAQIDELVRLDCHAAQGFLFGRPVPTPGDEGAPSR